MKKDGLTPLGGDGSDKAVFVSQDGRIALNVRIEGESVWLTQTAMAELFGCTPENVVQHLKNVYAEGELQETATTKNFLVVRMEGKREVSRQLKHYNLDAIIAIGYRVNSHLATQFRIWATKVLKEYIIKGFALDDERMKTGRNMTYFDELLQFNGRELLKGAGSIAHAVAEETAALRLEEYRDNLRAEERRASLEELERDLKEIEDDEKEPDE